MPVQVSMENGVGIVTFSNPPVNALSARAGIPQDIQRALLALDDDERVCAMVLTSTGSIFCAGADIAEFREDPQSDVGPGRALNETLDRLHKPVVAAIQGRALGGGLELALAADYRIAATDAFFALPEVTLGLIPGGGGTQRLPRLVPPARALDMMVSGQPVHAVEALGMGLVDAIAPTALQDEAAALARRVARAGRRRTRDGALPAEEFLSLAKAARARAKEGPLGDAARAALDSACTGALHGYEEGLHFEYEAFDRLMLGEVSRGLRHAFLAERACAHLPALKDLPRRSPVGRAGIVGSGTMGTGIAVALAQAGIRVTVCDASAAALERAAQSIGDTIARGVELGRLSPEEGALQKGRIALSSDMADLADADILVEAVFEDLAIKQGIFRDLDRIARPDAILATNTSTLDVDRIAEVTSRPDSVVGMHFFSPANVMRLVEVVRGARTSPETLSRAMAFTRQIRKVGVVSGVCDGFIGNRMFEEYLRQAYFLLEEGAFPRDIDGAMERWGMAMGPLRTMDLAGQDIGWNIRKRRAIEQPDRPYSRIPDLICEQGRFGQKTGAGYYTYAAGASRPMHDDTIDSLIVEESRRLGIPRRRIGEEEIVDRCLLALLNEGARILEDGIAGQASDIDTVWVSGYGFPGFRGGPMFHAERRGLAACLDQLAVFARGYQGWCWTPSDVLLKTARSGDRFDAGRDTRS